MEHKIHKSTNAEPKQPIPKQFSLLSKQMSSPELIRVVKLNVNENPFD